MLISSLFLGANSCMTLSKPSQNFSGLRFVPSKSSLFTKSAKISETFKFPIFLYALVIMLGVI